jgi:hypothetical protein
MENLEATERNLGGRGSSTYPYCGLSGYLAIQ